MELDDENGLYKTNTEKEYNEFLDKMKIELNNIDVKEEKESSMKHFMIKELCHALEFLAGKRPSMNEILIEMKEFEKRIKLENLYLNMEKEYEEEVMKLLTIDNNKGYTKFVTKCKYTICKNCIEKRNIKGIFVCNHKICKDCINQFAIQCFLKNESYNHTVFCSTCKKFQRLSKCNYNIRIY